MTIGWFYQKHNLYTADEHAITALFLHNHTVNQVR